MTDPEGASIEEAVTKAKEFQEQKRQPRKWSDAAKQAHSTRLKTYFKEHPEKREALSEKIRAGWCSASDGNRQIRS